MRRDAAGTGDLRRREEQLLTSFRERGLLREGGTTTIFGQPPLRLISPGHEPQRLLDATTRQKRLAEYAYSTPATGKNSCAAWVELVFLRFGYCAIVGHAFQVYEGYCHLNDLALLKAGMMVAVPRHPFSVDGRRYGHVGIYVGDRLVRDCVDTGVRTVPLELWLSDYGVMAEPRWGWLGSIALDL